MKHSEAVEALAALAQGSRLAVFRLLVKRGPEGYPAGVIGERLDIPGPTLSFHLKALAQAGLVSMRREGRFLHYSANFAGMNAVVAYLTENCCGLGSAREPLCAPVESRLAMPRLPARRAARAGRR